MFRTVRRPAVLSIATLLLLFGTVSPTAGSGNVDIEVFAPKSGDVAGVANRGFLIDLVARFDTDLAGTRARIQTAPNANAAAGGHNENFKGLVVLLSGRGAENLANRFNLVAVTNRKEDRKTDIWTTWIVGAAAFGSGESRLFVAIVEGTAPDAVQDRNGDGKFDEKDLEAMGFNVISNVRKVNFVINPNQ